MRYHEIVNEKIGINLLYHGIRNIDHAIEAVETNQMAGTSTQKFWADGKRRLDNDPTYNRSYWMKGVSATRDINYAMHWSQSVVFVLDRAEIAKHYKIIPFNWGYSIPDQEFHKREREEFIVTKMTKDDYYIKDEYDDEERFDMNRFRNKTEGGYLKPLSKILKGIYVCNEKFDSDHYKDKAELLASHPKFIGYYDETDNFVHTQTKARSYGYINRPVYYAAYTPNEIVATSMNPDRAQSLAQSTAHIRKNRDQPRQFDMSEVKIALMSPKLARKIISVYGDKTSFKEYNGMLYRPDENPS